MRADLHTEAIRQLRDNFRPNPFLDDKFRIGSLAHARAMAILTRKRHPYLLPTYSLEHHDRNEKNPDGNFDIALIESLPYGMLRAKNTVRLYKLQVKASCFGQCNRYQPSVDEESNQNAKRERQRSLELFLETRKKYNPSITLISGCCDFRATSTPNSSRVMRPEAVNRLLIAEHDNTISRNGRFVLDGITNHLLLIATAKGQLTGRGGRSRNYNSLKYERIRATNQREVISLAPEKTDTTPQIATPATFAAIVARRALPQNPEA